MTEQEVQAFCQNNGISVSPPGQQLHVLDPTELPASVREFVNDDGSYKGDNTPESEDARHEESKGEADADDTKIRKALGDTPDEAKKREASTKQATKKR